MANELERAMAKIRTPGHPRPHYISHLLRDEEIWTIQARYGSLFSDTHRRRRDCCTDVRIGSYRYDQVEHGGLQYNSKDDESYSYVELPFGDQLDGIRHGLWHLTEARYREAGDRLRRLIWDPLAPHFGDSRQVIVVPEGSIHLVSFSTLPLGSGEFLAESGPAIHYVSAERDLVRSPGPDRGHGLLALGGPSFG